jgi:hypothetical protein
MTGLANRFVDNTGISTPATVYSSKRPNADIKVIVIISKIDFSFVKCVLVNLKSRYGHALTRQRSVTELTTGDWGLFRIHLSHGFALDSDSPLSLFNHRPEPGFITDLVIHR